MKKTMNFWMISLLLFVMSLVCATSSFAQKIKVDRKIPKYKKISGVSGNLNSIGSDTLNNLMTLWAESFRKQYPNINIQIEGKGSSTAPPALIEGTAQLGPMSRKMKSKETNKFEKEFGFKPTAIGVALDSLAVFVNKDNPIEHLSLQEVDAMFSSTRKYGLSEVSTWGQVGLSGEWANKPVSLYGRNSASGTYGYFKKVALKKGDFRNSVKEQPGSASVVLGITEELGGIGYSGIGYTTSGVRAIPLSKKKGDKAFEPNYKNVLAGKYPLARVLYVYVSKPPNGEAAVLPKEFLRFVLSRQGQKIVVKDGYMPLPGSLVKKQLATLGVTSS